MYIVNMGLWNGTVNSRVVAWLPSPRCEKAAQTFPFAYFIYIMFSYLTFHSRELSFYFSSDVAKILLSTIPHQESPYLLITKGWILWHVYENLSTHVEQLKKCIRKKQFCWEL